MSETALVIGGGGDIGQAICDRLGQDGIAVRATTRADLDLSDPASVSAFTADLSAAKGAGYNHIVFAAAVNVPRPYLESQDEDLQAAVEINLMAFLRLLRPLLLARPDGDNRSVTIIGSLFGMVGRHGRLPYSVSKHALMGATKTLAVELGPKGVRVNCVSPGFIDTKLTRQNIPPQSLQRLERLIPVGRLGQPEEIADTVAFLTSPRARYINGTNMVIDGGFMAGGFLNYD